MQRASSTRELLPAQTSSGLASESPARSRPETSPLTTRLSGGLPPLRSSRRTSSLGSASDLPTLASLLSSAPSPERPWHVPDRDAQSWGQLSSLARRSYHQARVYAQLAYAYHSRNRLQSVLIMWTVLGLLFFTTRSAHWSPPPSGGPTRSEELQATAGRIERALPDAQGSIVQPLDRRKAGDPLRVCMLTADFWGMASAGGTATAYHLLAQVLAMREEQFRVTLVGVSKDVNECRRSVRSNSRHGINFECLTADHYLPEVVESYPYERQGHAALAWLDGHLHKCEVVHAHEWGGLAVAFATVLNARQAKPGLRLVLEPHGGHFWSTQGQVVRPWDVVSMRIDHAERMALQLASALISPTRYMTAYLKLRGWRLPPQLAIIPNVMPEMRTTAVVSKPVWRLVFFSRLEERKGLRLFVDAVSRLANSTLDGRFEVEFVGSEARLDLQTSGEWLQEKTAAWSFPTHIKVNANRTTALEVLSAPGSLLVLCSLVENMPYVVAEAIVKGIPFVVCDVGGIAEMMDMSAGSANIISETSTDALYKKLDDVLRNGSMTTASLHASIEQSTAQWLAWHAEFAKFKLHQAEQEDVRFLQQLSTRTASGRVFTQALQQEQSSLELYHSVCQGTGSPRARSRVRALPGDAILLLPPEFELMHASFDPAASERLLQILEANTLADNGIGALSFGIKLPDGRLAYPTAPTWIAYGGDDSHCYDNIPVLIRRSTFCDVFVAEARLFLRYSSWLLALLLSQAHLRMHTYPRPAFQAFNWTDRTGSCLPDHAPKRDLPFSIAANLYDDSEKALVNLHLAPFPRPATSLVEDFPSEQGHKGWMVGFTAHDQLDFRPLEFAAEPDGGAATDGRWHCQDEEKDFPSLHRALAHPCAMDGEQCCGLARADFVLRFESFFAAPNAGLTMAYEVWPVCGDGLDLEVRLTPQKGEARELMTQAIEVEEKGRPQRHKVEVALSLHRGDFVDLLVHARSNHDCDGVFLIDVQVWQDRGGKPAHI